MTTDRIFDRLSDFRTSFMTKMARGKAEMVGPARLLDPISSPHGSFLFRIQLSGTADYEVQASTDLTTWEKVADGTAPSNPMDFVDAGAANHNYRFYHVVSHGLPSQNIIGYVSFAVPPGFSMISNPLKGSNNAIGTLFSKMPDGASLSKYDSKLFRLTNNVVKNNRWQNPDDTLVPGEGAIFFNPTDEFITLGFVGDVMQGSLLNPIPAGFSIRSSIVPQSGRLHPDLEFPMADSDVVHIFNRDKQQYVIYNYPSKEWDANPPVLAVGESFWVGKTSPGNWVRQFRSLKTEPSLPGSPRKAEPVHAALQEVA